MSNELATIDNRELARVPGLLAPVAPIAAIMETHSATVELINKTLEYGLDYGPMPGTKVKEGEKERQVLWQPGAQKICIGFGVYGVPTIVSCEIDHSREIVYVKREKYWNNAYKGDKSFTWRETPARVTGIYRYTVRVDLVHRASGMIVGSGMGMASSLEAKYIDRPFEVENTILKMAEKRAFVGGTLYTFGLSGRFTQDVEDGGDDAPIVGQKEVTVISGAKPRPEESQIVNDTEPATSESPEPLSNTDEAKQWYRSIGLTPAQAKQFKEVCEGKHVEWPNAALMARDQGCSDWESLYAFGVGIPDGGAGEQSGASADTIDVPPAITLGAIATAIIQSILASDGATTLTPEDQIKYPVLNPSHPDYDPFDDAYTLALDAIKAERAEALRGENAAADAASASKSASKSKAGTDATSSATTTTKKETN